MQLAREQEQLRIVTEPGELVTEMQLLDLGQEWAAVQVVVGQRGSPTAYRQTRIYLQTARGWVRTAPAATYWGKVYELETRYFNIHYFARDAQAVEAVANQLDLLYPTLYAHFFPDPPGLEKLVIKVSPEFVPKELLQATSQQDTLEVPSPASTLAPANMTERDLLAQSLLLALLDQLAYQLEQRYELPHSGRILSKALRLWLVWNQELPLASWQEPVVRWVFWAPPADAALGMSAIPEFAHELCANHHTWMPSPIEIGIPIACFTRAGADEEISAWRYPYMPPLQVPLPLPFDVSGLGSESEHGGQLPEPAATVVVLATVVEYVAATGRFRGGGGSKQGDPNSGRLWQNPGGVHRWLAYLPRPTL